MMRKSERKILLLLLPLIPILILAKNIVPKGSSIVETISSCHERLKRIKKNKPPLVMNGSLTTIEYHLNEAITYYKTEPGYGQRSLKRAIKYIQMAESGVDPLESQRGMVTRAYTSIFSKSPQPYSVFVPYEYDRGKKYGLILNLHGGSSTHNLFLAVTLGNWNIPWKSYWKVRHNEFTPQLKPRDFLVAAPDGFGQLRWRWMAEIDVFEVISDIRFHYSIDPSLIAVCGLSNGGIGAYSIGTKYASSFSSVFAMAGISDWLLFFNAKRLLWWSKKVLMLESAINYAMNAKNTFYYFTHGEKDAGPMKVIQARAMDERLKKLGIPHTYREIPNWGHDIIWVLWGKGRIFNIVKNHPKRGKPDEVWLETLSYRANRQFWLELVQMKKFLNPATMKAKYTRETNSFSVETINVESFIIHLHETNADLTKKINVKINGGAEITLRKIPQDGRILLLKKEGGWKIESFPISPEKLHGQKGLRKTRGLSGPITDVNYDRQVHVYGSQVASDTNNLRKAAEIGARNWIKAKQFSTVDFPVKKDIEVTLKDIADANIIIYGTYHENSFLRKIATRLPIVISPEGIKFKDSTYSSPDVGTVFIYPNPLNKRKYIVVISGNSLEAVLKGCQLMPFLPDYVIFNKKTRIKSSMAKTKSMIFIKAGFFNEYWQID